MSRKGLANLTVLEIADTPGAAFAVSMLADFGARAIICEPPTGSELRSLGFGTLDRMRWHILARNKESVVIDEPAIIRALLCRADLLVTDRVLAEKAGHPWFAVLDTVPEADRPLVVEVFPTGADRPDLWPWSRRAEFAAAASGVMALTGHTGKPPIQAEAPIAEYLSGTLAAARALMALRRAQLEGGKADRISVPLHKALQRMIEWQAPVATAMGRAETRMGNNFPMNAGIANMHPTREGKYVAISAVTQATALRLMNMVGGPELCADPRFATQAARSRGLDDLYAMIDAWTSAHTTAEILAEAAEQDVVLGPIFDTDDILADEQVAARQSIVEVSTNDGSSVRMPAVIPRISDIDDGIRRLGPEIGADTEAVLAGLISNTGRADAHVSAAGQSRRPNGEREGPIAKQWEGEGAGSAFAELPGRHPSGATPSPSQPYGLGPSLSPLGRGGRDRRRDILVIELGAVIAGPFAGSLLAELGGEVIKVETPGAGDSLRQMGRTKEGVPLWYGAATREKRCVSLNLKHPAGKDLFLRLIAKADVLVENFRPGVLERLGLGWEDLRRVNPGLVMLSISGFGQTGPQSGRPGFGKIAEGLSGVVNLTGEAEAAPLFVGFSLADASAGLFGVHGVAVALFLRDVLGAGGSRIDLALYEPLMRMLDCQFALHAEKGAPPARGGTNDPYGFGTISPDRPRFCSVESHSGTWYFLAIPDEAVEERLNARIAADTLAGWCRRMPDTELESALAALGIEFTPVMDGLSIANARYFQARGDVVWTETAELGRIAAAGPVGDDPEGRPGFHAPAIGEHNAAVFGDLLGLDSAELARLKAEGAI